jgi:hypothetical protein
MSLCDLERPVTHPISPWVNLQAYLAFALGMACLACSLLALVVPSIGFLPFVVISCLVTIPLSRLAQNDVQKSQGTLGCKRWALAGLTAACVGLSLGAVPPTVEVVSDRQHLHAAQSHLKQIGLALFAYSDLNDGKFPPPVVRSESGKPLYSWRVLLLPQLGEEELFSAFHLDEAWDSAHNAALLSRMPKVYESSGMVTGEPNSTYYQLIVGPETVFGDGSPIRFPQKCFRKGTSNTIIIAEGGEHVPWSQPVDLVYKSGAPLPKLGGVFRGDLARLLYPKPDGVHVLLADASVRFLLWKTVKDEQIRHAVDYMEPEPEGCGGW